MAAALPRRTATFHAKDMTHTSHALPDIHKLIFEKVIRRARYISMNALRISFANPVAHLQGFFGRKHRGFHEAKQKYTVYHLMNGLTRSHVLVADQVCLQIFIATERVRHQLPT